METAADRAVEVESVSDLLALTAKSPTFHDASQALEQIAGDNGMELQLDRE